MIGVASAHAEHGHLALTGLAGLVAGAMSMATGEYVSVSSQADPETAALAEEQAELDADGAREHRELAAIYVRRGLDMALAKQVAQALMTHDALGAHARDELGISETTAANPLQTALASASSFSVGAALPLIVTALAPHRGSFDIAGLMDINPSKQKGERMNLGAAGNLSSREIRS